MDFTTLQNVSPVYPMYIKQYKDTLLDPNSDVQTKMNSVVQSLNQLSQNENDLVNNWNKVMQWAMNDGLDAAVSTQIAALEASGYFDSLLTSLFNSELGTETLATSSQDIKGAINEVKGIADSNTSALADIVSCRQYGFVADYTGKPQYDGNDGTRITCTDNTLAFQKMLDDCIAKKNLRVYFPAGHYGIKIGNVQRDLTGCNLSIFGDGMDLTIIDYVKEDATHNTTVMKQQRITLPD
jgi:hypothetical protein